MSTEAFSAYSGKRFHLHVSGAIGASQVPWWIHWLREVNPDVVVDISYSPSALRFVARDALEQLTMGNVWLDDWNDPNLPASWRAGGQEGVESIVVFPATLDTTMRLASGRADSPALMMMQISNLPIVICDVFPAMNLVIESQVERLRLRENVHFAPRVEGYRADSRERVVTGFNFPGALSLADQVRAAMTD